MSANYLEKEATLAQRRLSGIKYYVPSKTYNGYTLFAPRGGPGVWLIDMEGNFVHHWEVEHGAGPYAQLLPNGNLLFAGEIPSGPFADLGGAGGELLEIDWEGRVVWRYDDPSMHHDFQRLPNGNTMILKWVKTPKEIAARVKGGIPGTEREGEILSDSFQEITPEGKVVWEWKAYEHLDPEKDAICPLCFRNEWTHANSCFILPDGDILTSFLRLNTIAIIDKKSGEFKWRWGPGVLAHQHNPTYLDNGNILVFDNGAHRPGKIVGYSRVLEVNLQGEIVWEFKEETPLHYHSSFISGCQRLPNGNTLICQGAIGRLIEVTREKEVVWEYISPFYNRQMPWLGLTNLVFRAYRYGPDYPGLKGKDLDPDKYELVLKRKARVEEEVARRLADLGY